MPDDEEKCHLKFIKGLFTAAAEYNNRANPGCIVYYVHIAGLTDNCDLPFWNWRGTSNATTYWRAFMVFGTLKAILSERLSSFREKLMS